MLHRGEPSPLHPSPALTRGSLLALGISQTSRESRGHPPVPHGRGIRGPAARAWEGDHGTRPAPWAGGWRALGPGTAGSAVLVSQSWSLPPGACARLGSCPECGACSGLAGPCPDSGGRASSGRGGRPLPATSIVPFPVHPCYQVGLASEKGTHGPGQGPGTGHLHTPGGARSTPSRRVGRLCPDVHPDRLVPSLPLKGLPDARASWCPWCWPQPVGAAQSAAWALCLPSLGLSPKSGLAVSFLRLWDR